MVARRFSNRFIVGTTAERSSFTPANYTDYFYWDTDVEKMYHCDGTAWNEHVGGGGGASAIDDLTDVDTTTVAPSNNDVLTWNDTEFLLNLRVLLVVKPILLLM